MKPFSIYINFPFRSSPCPYSSEPYLALPAGDKHHHTEKEYTSTIIQELKMRASEPHWNKRAVKAVYIGGGNPSLMSPQSIRRLIFYTAQVFRCSLDTEFTLEAYPQSLDPKKISQLKSAGINKINFTVQSFNAEHLTTLGQLHSPDQTQKIIELAIETGFRSVGAALLFGIPYQTVSDFKDDLIAATKHKLDHLKFKKLTLVKGSEFYTRYKDRKKVKLCFVDEEVVERMQNTLYSYMEGWDYNAYRLNNFAKPNKQSHYLKALKDRSDILGLGAGAKSRHTSASQTRLEWTNKLDPKLYKAQINAADDSHRSCHAQKLTLGDQIYDFVASSLQSPKGIDLASFSKLFKRDFLALYRGPLLALRDANLIHCSHQAVWLTAKGILLAEEVIENFRLYQPVLVEESFASPDCVNR